VSGWPYRYDKIEHTDNENFHKVYYRLPVNIPGPGDQPQNKVRSGELLTSGSGLPTITQSSSTWAPSNRDTSLSGDDMEGLTGSTFSVASVSDVSLGRRPLTETLQELVMEPAGDSMETE
jgi:hypothetical protein